jgi:hypothetical protein
MQSGVAGLNQSNNANWRLQMPNLGRTLNPGHDDAPLSRRGVLRSAVTLLGAAGALLAAGLPAIAKMAQKAAGYQATPKGDQSCANCALFKAPDACTLVDGAIAAGGWCRFYAKKS